MNPDRLIDEPQPTFLSGNAVDRQLATEQPHVYRLALRFCRNRHVAEDLTQETMLKAVKNQDQLKSTDRLRVWLFQILTNTWRDHVRRTTRQPALRSDTSAVHAACPAIDEVAMHREQLQVALDAMDTLPEKQRAVLHLFAVEKFSLAEIGDVLGMKASTAKVNLCHARRAMREKLPEYAPPIKDKAVRPLR